MNDDAEDDDMEIFTQDYLQDSEALLHNSLQTLSQVTEALRRHGVIRNEELPVIQQEA